MSLMDIRKELHDYIDSADENHLKAVYEILSATNSANDFSLSDEHKQMLDERLKAYYDNPTDIVTWEDIQEKYKKQ